MKKIFSAVALFVLIFVSLGARGDWPEAPWINGAPLSDAVVTAIAFVSPLDLQFFRVMHIWKKLQKRYGPLNVDFLIVAMQEPGLPFDSGLVESTAHQAGYTFPVLIDGTDQYAKLWRAYVSPTVNLVSREGKVTSFDPGNLDPALFEKTLQKLLKEKGTAALPAREYGSESEAKGCGHAVTSFLGERFLKAWGTSFVALKEGWSLADTWVGKSGTGEAQMEIPASRSSIGVIAEAQGPAAKINVTLDGVKIPSDLRGPDIQEDKNGTYLLIRGPRLYEILAHSSKQKETGTNLLLSTDAKSLKVWAAQTMPYCQD